jgi:hypothetical protein
LSAHDERLVFHTDGHVSPHEAYEQWVSMREVERAQMLRALYDTPQVTHREGPFSTMMTERRAQFRHEPYCGAHAQYILDEDHTPRLVDGYSAIRWRAAGGSVEIGLTEWGAQGWHVATRLDHYGGAFYTYVVANGYDANGLTKTADDPATAMDNHREAVTLVMKLAKFHGLEASPSLDHQVLLERALA